MEVNKPHERLNINYAHKYEKRRLPLVWVWLMANSTLAAHSKEADLDLFISPGQWIGNPEDLHHLWKFCTKI